MKVILNQDVKDLGKKGQLVETSDGYAKNYLIPRKIAVIADTAALNELKNREAAKAHRIEVEKAEAKAAAEAIDGKTVKIAANAGANGRLFGSVTSKEVASKLNEEFKVSIDKKNISIDDIRNFGTYEAVIKIYTGISAKVYVVVGE